jgi:hypothetical protein
MLGKPSGEPRLADTPGREVGHDPGVEACYAPNDPVRVAPNDTRLPDWNWRGDDWRCRSRHTRGPSSLHARCDAALFYK